MSQGGYEQAAAEVEGHLPSAVLAGEKFTLHGEITALDMSELARAAGVDSESVEGAAILADIFRAAFGDHVPEGQREYARFRRHLRTVRAGDDVYVAALGACVEAFAALPTQRPSASPPTRSVSTAGSRGAGSSPAAPVVVGEVVVEEPDEEEADPEPAVEQMATVVNIGRHAS